MLVAGLKPRAPSLDVDREFAARSPPTAAGSPLRMWWVACPGCACPDSERATYKGTGFDASMREGIDEHSFSNPVSTLHAIRRRF